MQRQSTMAEQNAEIRSRQGGGGAAPVPAKFSLPNNQQEANMILNAKRACAKVAKLAYEEEICNLPIPIGETVYMVIKPEVQQGQQMKLSEFKVHRNDMILNSCMSPDVLLLFFDDLKLHSLEEKFRIFALKRRERIKEATDYFAGYVDGNLPDETVEQFRAIETY